MIRFNNKSLMRLFFCALFLSAFSGNLSAQERPVTFQVTVSADSILMNNYFEVSFTLENANGSQFEAPDLQKQFKIVSGPNYATSMQISNGHMTQNTAITYLLEPVEPGIHYIEPASIQAGDQILETIPIEIMVVPNPDGIKQPLPRQKDLFDFDLSDPFGFDFPPLEALPAPDPPHTEQDTVPLRRKLKTIRI